MADRCARLACRGHEIRKASRSSCSYEQQIGSFSAFLFL
jgi:hypothetical protein